MNKNEILSLLCAGAIAVTCSCNDAVTTVDSISVLSPDGSRIISLNNSEVTDYVNNYYLGSSLNYLDKTKGDHYFPEPVEIKWTGEKNGNYLVSVSEKEDFSDSRTYTTTSPELKIENLYGGQKYFYKIEDTVSGKTSGVKTFGTKKAPRTLKIDGVSNTRDVGGYDVSGKRVKQGMVYRGATPENISEEGKKTFAGLGIKTIIDLRGAAERKRNFSDINYVKLPEKGGPYRLCLGRQKFHDARVYSRADSVVKGVCKRRQLSDLLSLPDREGQNGNACFYIERTSRLGLQRPLYGLRVIVFFRGGVSRLRR